MGQVHRVSILVPVSDLPLDARYSVYDQALQMATRGAMMDSNLKDYDIALRPLAGNDVGLAGHGWNEQVSRTVGAGNSYENSAINATVAEDRYIVIYGVYIASSVDSVSSLRFEVGGARTHQWDLQAVLHGDPDQITPEQRRMLVFPPPNGQIDPVMIPSNTSILVQHYVRGGSAVGIQPTELVLLGVVAERLGGGGGALYGGATQGIPYRTGSRSRG